MNNWMQEEADNQRQYEVEVAQHEIAKEIRRGINPAKTRKIKISNLLDKKAEEMGEELYKKLVKDEINFYTKWLSKNIRKKLYKIK